MWLVLVCVYVRTFVCPCEHTCECVILWEGEVEGDIPGEGGSLIQEASRGRRGRQKL